MKYCNLFISNWGKGSVDTEANMVTRMETERKGAVTEDQNAEPKKGH